MTEKPNLKEELYKKPCDKNQGHFAHFLIKDLKMEFLPTGVRHADFLKAVELMARLTVRIIVKKLSTKRPSSSEGEPAKYLIGTGSCLETPAVKWIPNEHEGSSRIWTSVKKYLPFHRKKYGEIYVETNSHVVFDDVEAENTTVEFYFNNLNRKNIVKVKGVAVKHSDQAGVYKCQLICHTEDLELVDRVNRDREEFWNLLKNLPADKHESLFRRVFVVGHPHGGEKILACGESQVKKYLLTSQVLSNRTVLGMKNIDHNERLPPGARNSVRKVLIFTTDTCIGMSGAPILSFKMTRDSGDGENGPVKVEPELWMHNGVDIKHDLAGSVMQDSTEEEENLSARNRTSLTNMSVRPRSGDFADLAEIPSIPSESSAAQPPKTPFGLTQFERLTEEDWAIVNENIDEKTAQERRTGSESVPQCPRFQCPRHQMYSTYKERLESFFDHRCMDPSPTTYLARAGFFVPRRSECVRCFYCDLDLSEWLEGDNAYRFHYMERPECPFLQRRLRELGINDPEEEFGRHQKNSARDPMDFTVTSMSLQRLVLREQQDPLVEGIPEEEISLHADSEEEPEYE